MGSEKTIGSLALETIADLWDATGPRVRWGKDGFAWWPGDFAVEVTAHKRVDGYVPETWMLSVRTDFLKDIPVGDPKFIRLAAVTAPVCAPTFAWVYPTAEAWAQHGEAGTRPRLWLSNTAYITADNVDWLPHFVAMMSIMQPINAQIQHENMANLLGGVADKSRPAALAGLGLHESHRVADQIFAPIGKETNRWIGTGEFQSIVEIGTTEYSDREADNGGLAIEASFGEDIALISLRTDQTHPALGTGLLATLYLPVYGERKQTAEQCASMNLIESMWTDDFPQLGCWYPQGSREGPDGLTFTTFVPNALYQPGLAHCVTDWMFRRARWLQKNIYLSRTASRSKP
jgi:hypothetical protein